MRDAYVVFHTELGYVYAESLGSDLPGRGDPVRRRVHASFDRDDAICFSLVEAHGYLDRIQTVLGKQHLRKFRIEVAP